MEVHPIDYEMTDNVPTKGISNEAFVTETFKQGTPFSMNARDETIGCDELPPLTYIDFIPECSESFTDGKQSKYAEFRSVVDQANKWLLTAPQFEVYKCETLSVKLDPDSRPTPDQTFLHFASNGKNIFLRILRVWLRPRTELNSPLQQLAYITVLPDHTSGSLTSFLDSLSGTTTVRNVGDINCASFDNLQTFISKLNNLLQMKPLPGRVLTVETVTFKCLESGTPDKLNTESTLWTEGGASTRMYMTGLQIYYVTGPPAYESIGVYDEVPEMSQSKDNLELKVKFATFDQTLAKASLWLRQQKDIRVTNFQTVNVKLDRKHISGLWSVDSACPCYIENQALTESRYTKVLRVAYVQGKKLDTSPLYPSINLSSKIFIPARLKGRRFESFSKTMQHVTKWLKTTGMPLFMCESARYQCSVDSSGQAFNDQRPDHVVNTYQGQYYLTCVRLYFATSYENMQPMITATREEYKGWSCSIS